ncbi:MAG: sigma-70 family RNA polymerase sigma factor [Phycisphaerales bacterium]|nr:sigma-70 family RNA polymerase sigma factor [Phycisphaerales bacterium]MCB9863829.1 sigma-70 family RNA polymerase sigma factor [Phycisphaerales bacterium]
MASKSNRESSKRIASGELSSLVALLRSNSRHLMTRIRRRIPADMRSVIAEEDILQETFIDAFRRITRFRPRGTAASRRWLTLIADHRLQDAVRAQHTLKRGGGRFRPELQLLREDGATDDPIDMLAGGEQSPSQAAVLHESVRAVCDGLASLKEDYRRAIQLRHFQRLSVRDAASELGKTPAAFRHLCRRGLKQLQAALVCDSLGAEDLL